MSSRTKIDDPDLLDILDGIDAGSVALPNFQRDFDWSDGDVRSLLATTLNGWPMGSLLLIEGDTTTQDFYAPRSFEFAPPLTGVPELIVLDGQQRMTALYAALYDVSNLVYAVQVDPLPNFDEIDAVDGAMRTYRRQKWDAAFPTPRAQWESGLIPLRSLRSASDFFAWRDAVGMATAGAELATQLYRERLSGLHRYRVPALRIDKSMPPAAVARIFERVNRTGQRLGTFDLMVAKSFSPSFNLRTEWEEAKERHPRLGRIFGENGVVPLQVISLRYAEDVRGSAVLSLSSAAIQDNWMEATASLDRALAFAEENLGVIRSDWIPYGNLMVVLGALAWEVDLNASAPSLEAWFWMSAFSGRYASGSNTQAVADFKSLRMDPRSLRRPFLVDRRLLIESTKQSSGAVHRGWLCALAAQYVRSSGELLERDLGARSIASKSVSVFGVPSHRLTLTFSLTLGGELLVDGPFSLFEVPLGDMDGQEGIEELVTERANALVRELTKWTGVDVTLADMDIAPGGLSD